VEELPKFKCEKSYRAPSKYYLTVIPLGSERYSNRKNRSDRPFFDSHDSDGYDRYDQFEEDQRKGR
jgi:hypothetical protein